MKKVLIITYYWPPAGGPGVQRVLKFAKYLPEFGWQPIILTVQNGEYPAHDESLFSDIPNECIVYKTPAIEPFSLYKKFTGMDADEAIPVATLTEKKKSWKKKLAHWIRLNLFIPDAKIGWIPYAVKAGKHIIRNEKPDIIFSSSPPPTVHLIAKSLARWSRIKWMADFRDPWTEIHYYHQIRSKLSRNLDCFLEQSILSSCVKATCVSKEFSKILSENDNSKFVIIPNGYDGIELHVQKHQTNFFDIIHVGGINRSRYYPAFFRSIANLTQSKFDNKKIRLLFIGKIEHSIKEDIIRDCAGLSKVEFLGYLPHHQATKYMCQASILLIFLEDVDNYEGHIPGKLFEYLVTGNYILGIGSEKGEAAEILSKTKAGRIFNKDDQYKIDDAIITQYKNWEKGVKHHSDYEHIKQFSRRTLTEKLVETFTHL